MKHHLLLLPLGFLLFAGGNSAIAQGVTTSAMKDLVLDAKG